MGERLDERRAITITRDTVDDRYARLRLIDWWDQERLAKGVAVVVGAGALGNEVLKNLALLGLGRVFVCDMDTIETSNLTRSTLYRLRDVGRRKAEVAVERTMEMNPDTTAVAVEGDVRFRLGLGVVRRADVILGCLDSVAARVAVNRHAFRMGKTFIDSGLDHLNGDVRVYALPDGPCYECGLTEHDRKTLKRRQSCLKLARDEQSLRKVPTSPTIASIAGGLQTQIAIRAMHGRPVPAGRRLGLYGMSDVMFDVKLSVSDECPAHGWVESLAGKEVVETKLAASSATLGDLLGEARRVLGPKAHVSLEDDREVIVGLSCAACSLSRRVLSLAGTLKEEDARCEKCGETMAPDLRARLDGEEGLNDRTLAELGLPPLHIIRIVDEEGGREALLELTGDLETLFGKREREP
jgi:molybdopterin/thiamine biosynthesis adenylyltransferase